MKRLVLALLISATAVIAVGQAPVASADCIHRRYYYYEYPGGPLCGYRYVYCESPSYQTGCQTPYYTFSGGCICP